MSEYIDITWRMTCPLTVRPLFFLRCQRPTTTSFRCPFHFSASSWTARPTGRVPPGAVSSAIFPGGSIPLHTENLPVSHGPLSQLLQHLQCHLSIPPHRATSLHVCILPRRPATHATDDQVISVSTPELANIFRPPRSEGQVLPAQRVQAGISRLRLMKGSQARIRLPTSCGRSSKPWTDQPTQLSW